MPIKPGTSQATVSSNIREIHQGPQYKATKKKHGAAIANEQAIAIAMKKKRESMGAIRKINTGKGVVLLRRIGVE